MNDVEEREPRLTETYYTILHVGQPPCTLKSHLASSKFKGSVCSLDWDEFEVDIFFLVPVSLKEYSGLDVVAGKVTMKRSFPLLKLHRLRRSRYTENCPWTLS